MALKVCFANQKGGVGKTTSAHSFCDYFARKGKRVLVIDLDSQWNLTAMYGVLSEDYEKDGNMDGQTIYQVFKGKPISDVVLRDVRPNIDLVVGSILMGGAEGEFQGADRFHKLKRAIKAVDGSYDLIVVDCPPTVGILTFNAFAACDGAVIAYKADALTKAGILQLKSAVDDVRDYFSADFKIFGVLVTMFDRVTKVSERCGEQAEAMAAILGTKVFKTKIRASAKVREIADFGESIFSFAPNSPAAKDYMAFCEEFEKEYM